MHGIGEHMENGECGECMGVCEFGLVQRDQGQRTMGVGWELGQDKGSPAEMGSHGR